MNEYDIKKITDCLGKYPVIAAYIFGSEATGKAGVLSDMDIAVLVDKDIDKSARFDMTLRLSSELSAILNRRADIVMLNDSTAQLSYEVIKHGRPIFCRDKSAKVDLEINILSRYLDRRFYDKRHADLTLERIATRGL